MATESRPDGQAIGISPPLRVDKRGRLLRGVLGRVRRTVSYVALFTLFWVRAFPREMGKTTLYLVSLAAFVGITEKLFGIGITFLLFILGPPAFHQIRRRQGIAWRIWDQLRWNRE